MEALLLSSSFNSIFTLQRREVSHLSIIFFLDVEIWIICTEQQISLADLACTVSWVPQESQVQVLILPISPCDFLFSFKNHSYMLENGGLNPVFCKLISVVYVPSISEKVWLDWTPNFSLWHLAGIEVIHKPLRCTARNKKKKPH